MADIALDETTLTHEIGRRRHERRHHAGPQPSPAPWSPRRKLLFLLGSASSLWALIGLAIWSLV